MTHRLRPDPTEIDVARLGRYLSTRLPDFDPSAPLRTTLLTGGRSNLTYLVQQGACRWVLRRPPLGHVMPSAHDMAREFDTLSLLARAAFPAPRPVDLCTDESVLGVVFLLMEHVPGLVVSRPDQHFPPTAPLADHLCGELVRTLVDLHRIPPPPLPAGRSTSAVAYLARQVTRWSEQWERTLTRELPALTQLVGWLHEQVAQLTDDLDVVLVHGDYRLDNLMLDPRTADVRAVLDWEMSTVGHPLMDLALLLVYWEEPQDRVRREVAVARHLTTAPGFWSRERLVDEYARASGVPMQHLGVCLALACLKLAVIMESVHYRHLSGEAVGELSSGLGAAAPALLALGAEIAAGRGLAGLSA